MADLVENVGMDVHLVAGGGVVRSLVLLLATGLMAAAPRYGVFLSADQGRSWVRADGGLPEGARVNALGAVGGALLAGTDKGMYVSRDRGRQWVGAGGRRVLSLAVLGTAVYAGTAKDGVLVSRDEGRSWVRDFGYVGKTAVRSLAVLAGRVYAGTDAEGVLVWDGGWRVLGAGLPEKGQVFALTVSGGRVYAGLYAKGLFVWEGVWRKVGGVTPLALGASGGVVVAGHNPGGIFWSGDGGGRWEMAAGLPLGRAAVWEMGSGEGKLFAGVEDGVFVSADTGRRWERVRMPVTGPGISFFVGREVVLVGVQVGQ